MKIDHLSEQLRATKDLLAMAEIDSERSLALYRRLDRLISMASLLETELSLRMMSQRASDNRAHRIHLQEAVLEALRTPGCNIRLFPIVPRDAHAAIGGDAA